MKTIFLSLSLFILASVTAFAQGNERAPLPCHASFIDTVIGNNVQFTNQSSGTYSLSLWTFGDGDSSIVKSPDHVYTTNRPYALVCLAISDTIGNCYSDTCDTIFGIVAGINAIDNPAMNMAIYPNPVAGHADIVYNLKESATVSIDVTDMLGYRVVQLFNGGQTAGKQQIVWQTEGVSNGIYLVRITLNGQSFTRRVSVLN